MAPHTITVALGRPATIPEEGLTIELLAVEDGRCPVEVRCVWAGHAAVTLRVTRAGTAAAQTLVVGTAAPAGMNLPFEAIDGSHRFTLLDLQPGNSLARPAAQSDYRATVLVSGL